MPKSYLQIALITWRGGGAFIMEVMVGEGGLGSGEVTSKWGGGGRKPGWFCEWYWVRRERVVIV